MINLKYLVFTFFIIVTSTITAQDYKFGKVSKAELEENYSPIDSSASATYLYKYRKTYFHYQSGQGFSLITKIHERLKIYNKEGFDYATKKVSLYGDGGSREMMSGLKAVTYNLKDGNIEESKLKKDGEFKVALSENWDQKSFTMPNINEGSVIEYKYEIRSPFIFNVDEFVFQHDIPVTKIEAIMDAPEYFVFRLTTKGFLKVMPEKSRENRSINLKYTSNISTYNLKNIPPLKDEPFVNELSNYRSGVKYELSYTQFPNAVRKQYATTWEAVVKAIYKSPSFGSELKRTSYFKSDLDIALSGISAQEDKILKIYTLVKSKMKWNNKSGKYTRDGVRKAYKEGVGNTAEINLMLTAMLNYAGLESNPVLVSTRSNGIPLFPTREGYNYVISSVQLPQGTVLLDATSKYSTPSVLPFRTLNWEGRIIKKDGSSTTVGLYPENKSTQRIFLNATVLEDGSLKGKLREVLTNHKALSFRNSYSTSNKEEFLRDLEEENGGIEIDNYEVKNKEDVSKSVVASYNYKTENEIDVISGKMYFAPLLFLATSENPFKLENREFPVDFAYPSVVKIASTISIPEGYKVEVMPDPIALALPDGLGSFKFNLLNNGKSLQLKVDVDMRKSVIAPHYYISLKEYYKKMIEKMNEKVVLSKI